MPAPPDEPAHDPAHEQALRAGAASYVDARTGLFVVTARGHEARGWCCGSGCRHCPWTGDPDPPRAPAPPDEPFQLRQ